MTRELIRDWRKVWYGRAAALGVAAALLITVATGFALYVARDLMHPPASEGELDAAAATEHLRRMTVMMSLLLASGLIIILFLVGSYFVLRAGRIATQPVGGKETTYVDAWRRYRLTDEQIAAATAEPDADDANDSTTTDEPPPRGG